MNELHKSIAAIVEELGYYVYDITYGPRPEGKVLSVSIDHEDGISIDDCVAVSEKLNNYLDDTDPIDESYSLEVISAGAEHELRTDEEIRRAIGKRVHVRTIEQTLEGVLESMTDTSITIRDDRKNTTTILMADVEFIRRAIEF